MADNLPNLTQEPTTDAEKGGAIGLGSGAAVGAAIGAAGGPVGAVVGGIIGGAVGGGGTAAVVGSAENVRGRRDINGDEDTTSVV